MPRINEDIQASQTNVGTEEYDNWFQHDYVATNLGITGRLSDSLRYQPLEYLKIQAKDDYQINSRWNYFLEERLYPAWSVAEPAYFAADFFNFYVPVYNLDDQDLKGLLIFRLVNNLPKFYYLSEDFVIDAHDKKESPFTKYWIDRFAYFYGAKNNDNYKNIFRNPIPEPCVTSFNGLCLCSISNSDCTGYIFIDGNDVSYDCFEYCTSGDTDVVIGDGGIGGGGNTGVGGSDQWDIYTFSNETDSPVNNGCINCSSNVPDDCYPVPAENYPPNYEGNFYTTGSGSACTTWDNYYQAFNCNGESFEEDTYPNNTSGELVIVLNSGDLHTLQLDIFISEYNLDMTSDEIKDIMESPCGTTLYQNTEDLAKYKLIDDLANGFNLPDSYKWVIFSNFNQYQTLLNALENGNPGNLSGEMLEVYNYMRNYKILKEELDPVFNFDEEEEAILMEKGLPSDLKIFLDENNHSEDAREYVDVFVDLLVNDSEYVWDRFKELYELLEDNPEAFIENCFDNPADISNWNDLLAFDVPQNCLDRLTNEGLGNQPLEFGNANTVNLDYYSITFNNLPNRPDGTPFSTIEEFFNYFRTHINDFIDLEISVFDYYTNSGNNDESLWLSNNPITTLFSIDIPILGPIADDGMVICSSNPGCCWVFSTVKTPGNYFTNTNGNDGTHPVSGNRLFGFKENINGSFSIYTKGADRARYNAIVGLFPVSGDAAYNGGADLWESLIDGLNDFVLPQNNGGNIILDKNSTGQRPKWDKIEAELKSLTTITVIPCD